MTQLELAVKSKCQPDQISKVERGKLDVRLVAFVRICDVLDVSADFLLGRSDKA